MLIMLTTFFSEILLFKTQQLVQIAWSLHKDTC